MLGHKDRITGEPQEQPFLATRGFNSVMWSRLYSREEYDTGAERDLVSTAQPPLISAATLGWSPLLFYASQLTELVPGRSKSLLHSRRSRCSSSRS